MARTVAELAFLLPIISGPDWLDPAIVPMPLNDPNAVDLKCLKVVFHTDNGVATPTPAIIQTVKNVVSALESVVLSVEEKRLEETWTLWNGLDNADGGVGAIEILRQAGTTQTYSINVDEIPEETAESSEEFGRRLREIDHFRSQMLQFIAPYDVLICPVNANTALKHGTVKDHFDGF